MEKITEITISLHCGCDQKVVDNQMKILSQLEDKYKVYWNNRIDRFPHAYPSYSEMLNEAIATSPTEFVIMVNDRVLPTVHQAQKIITLLENGFACAMQWNVGFMGLSKELVRKIGWWDQRYTNGGWEDRDWVFRMVLEDLAFYESQESDYDFSWKSPLQVMDGCDASEPHFVKKWKLIKDEVCRVVPEEQYSKWDEMVGEPRPDISESWKSNEFSVLGINDQGQRARGYEKPNSGPANTAFLFNRKVVDKC